MADEFELVFDENITQQDIKAAAGGPNSLRFVSIPKQFEFKVGFISGDKDFKTKAMKLLEEKRITAIAKKYRSQLLTTLVFIFEEGNNLSQRQNLNLDDTIKTIKNAADSQFKAVHDNCIKEIEALFDEIKKKNKEYRAVQIKAVVQFTLGGVSIVANVAALASSPFTLGFSTIYSLMSIVKTAAAMGKQVYESLLSVDKVLKKLETELAEVKKKFAGNGPHKTESLKALGNQLVSTFLGVELIPTILECQKQFATVEHKVHGVYQELRGVAAKMLKAEKKCEKLSELMKDKNNLALSNEEMTKLMYKYAGLSKQVRDWKFKIDVQLPKFRDLDAYVTTLGQDLALLVHKKTTLVAFQGRFETFLDWSSILLAVTDAKTLVDAGAKVADAFKDFVKDKAQQAFLDEASNQVAAAEIKAEGWLKIV